jgi:BirA family biotin operon repressor/biotin-[acetyl-CoA-carboxylase] ligase
MEWKIKHIDETDSTNQWMRNRLARGQNPAGTAADDNSCGDDCNVVWADYQTAGRGCGTNTWESERGKNLLFTMHLTDVTVPGGEGRLTANRQFHISMVASLAICEALGRHIGDLSIKWPNDIYWRNGKIGGMLIEHRLQGEWIRDSIIGVGLNVNQRAFLSGAPNPVSLWQISEQETNREQLLRDILQAFGELIREDVGSRYRSMLYRRKGFHPYTDREGAFMAELVDVADNGCLLLRDDNGRERSYAFKEVQYII